MTALEIRTANALPIARAGVDAPAVAARLASLIGFAAAPTFALMAVATILDAGPIAKVCGAGTPLGGMVPMYLLMSAFHAPPWLKLIRDRR